MHIRSESTESRRQRRRLRCREHRLQARCDHAVGRRAARYRGGGFDATACPRYIGDLDVKVPSSTPEKPAAAKSQPLPAPAEPGPRRTEEKEYVPRFVALPRHWERGNGRRNLVGGVVLLV